MALAAVVTVGSGCAAIRKGDVDTQEQLLSAAGFQMKLADTPQRLEHLQTMTSQKLVPHTKDGKLYYVYADPEFCKCLFVGNEPAYQKYQQLALQQKSPGAPECGGHERERSDELGDVGPVLVVARP
jgi:hypothetical protein